PIILISQLSEEAHIAQRPPTPPCTPLPRALRHPPSFPTRRSSDLTPSTSARTWSAGTRSSTAARTGSSATSVPCSPPSRTTTSTDRKSTRLNSSHVSISYAVFCL